MFLKTSSCGCTLKKKTIIVGCISSSLSLLFFLSTVFTQIENDAFTILELLKGLATWGILVITSAVLVFAAIKRNTWLVLLWVVSCFLILMTAIIDLSLAGFIFCWDRYNKKGSGFVTCVALVIFYYKVFHCAAYAVLSYCWFVVIRYYRELRSAERQEMIHLFQKDSTPKPTKSYSSTNIALNIA